LHRGEPRQVAAAPFGIDRGLRPGSATRPVRKAVESVTRARATVRYLPGSIIVKFRAGTSTTARAALIDMIEGRSAPARPGAPFDVVDLDPVADPEAAAQRLSGQPDVRVRAGPIPRTTALQTQRSFLFPAVELSGRRYGARVGHQPRASTSVTVAVLDSGMAYTNISFDLTQTRPQSIDGVLYPALGTVHLAFAAASDLVGSGRIVSPFDFIWGDSTPVDMDGHGTHVAGTIGQLTNNSTGVAGMAFNVKLMPVKVIEGFWDDYFESPFFGTDDTVALGIRYAADNGAKVLNMSIGRDGPPAPVVRDAWRTRFRKVRSSPWQAATSSSMAIRSQVRGNAAQIEGVVSVGSVGRDSCAPPIRAPARGSRSRHPEATASAPALPA
jgi:subtilisin family serine protease